jgi:DNA-binding Lrp family transcriptional regulator
MFEPFAGLITSKTRIQILMRLFLNPARRAHLRELATEFGASPSHIKNELAQLTSSGLLTGEKSGRQIDYSANTSHPLFPELHSMVKKALGMDHILESMLSRLGNLELAYLLDDYAEGKDSGIVDLCLVGDIDLVNLQDLTKKSERYLERKIRTLVLTTEEHQRMRNALQKRPSLILWQKAVAQPVMKRANT